MSPITTPVVQPDRFAAVYLNNVWRAIETVDKKSFIICDAANAVAAQFLAQAANEKYARAIQTAVEQINKLKSENFKRGFLHVLTSHSWSLN